MSSKITAFAFSKDRPSQLFCLLDSLRVNAPDLFHPWIYYRASAPEYFNGYMDVINEFPDCRWRLETETNSYKLRDFKQAMQESEALFSIFTDDCIFYRPCAVTQESIVRLFEEDSRLLCFNFRLGYNTIVQDYSTGRIQPSLTKVTTEGNFIKWDADRYYLHNNFGYLWNMDGATYLTKDILYITEQFEELRSFRDWEGALSNPDNKIRRSLSKTWLASFPRSFVVNVPCNSVQDSAVGHSEKISISTAKLNEMFLDGSRIDWQRMDFSDIIGSHQEVPLVFKNI